MSVIPVLLLCSFIINLLNCKPGTLRHLRVIGVGYRDTRCLIT